MIKNRRLVRTLNENSQILNVFQQFIESFNGQHNGDFLASLVNNVLDGKFI